MDIEIALLLIEEKKEAVNAEKGHSTEYLMGMSCGLEYVRNGIIAMLREEERRSEECDD